MILTLDVGNTQIYGGIFENGKLSFQFRKTSHGGASSDEVGVFLKSVLRENNIDSKQIDQIAMCSVVPDAIHSIRGACQKYFGRQPFILQAGARTGLKVRYRNPLEVGADRVANAIAASALYPDRNAIIIDLGTATTFCVLSAEKDYLGGMILPGLRISMEALEQRTAKLPTVEIVKPEEVVGKTTVESIQSGLFYSHLSTMTMMSQKIKAETFQGAPTVVIGTGGFSRLFEKEKVFDAMIPELVHIGLFKALEMNA